MDLNNHKFRAFAVGTGLTENSSPTWASPLNNDDYQAVPTQIVPPLRLCLSIWETSAQTLWCRFAPDWPPSDIA